MFCPLLLVIRSAFEIVSEKLSSCANIQTARAVVSYTVLSVPTSNWKIRFGKQSYTSVFILRNGILMFLSSQ